MNFPAELAPYGLWRIAYDRYSHLTPQINTQIVVSVHAISTNRQYILIWSE